MLFLSAFYSSWSALSRVFFVCCKKVVDRGNPLGYVNYIAQSQPEGCRHKADCLADLD
jgi:hypothetical protein